MQKSFSADDSSSHQSSSGVDDKSDRNSTANLAITVAGVVVAAVALYSLFYGISLYNLRNEAREHVKQIERMEQKASGHVQNIETLAKKQLSYSERSSKGLLDVKELPEPQDEAQAKEFLQSYEGTYGAILGEDVHFKAAIAYRILQKWDDMLAETIIIIRINPRLLRAYILKSFALMCLGEYEAARKVCDQLIYSEKEKVIQKAWYNRASANALLKRKNEFLEDLKFVVSLNSDWKDSAKSDLDFQAFSDDLDFKEIIK